MKRHSTLTAILLAGLASGVSGQSAENFQSSDGEAEAASQKAANEAQMEVIDEESASELLASPSRYAGLDVESYVQAVSSSFSMRTRDIDPFARHQDPNFKPIKPKLPKRDLPKFAKDTVTPFSDIVKRINITAVMPAQQTFLIDGRSFTVGDRIKLDTGKEEPIAVHVIRIQSSGILFRHGVTGETATLSLKFMPEGMTPGKNSTPPWLPKNSNPPINARPPNAISSRR